VWGSGCTNLYERGFGSLVPTKTSRFRSQLGGIGRSLPLDRTGSHVVVTRDVRDLHRLMRVAVILSSVRRVLMA